MLEGWLNLLCVMIGQLSSYTAVGQLSDVAAGASSLSQKQAATSPELRLQM
jgi:hypothetical protein